MKPIPDEPNVEEFITMTPDEIPVHLKQGKAYLAAGGRREAVKEFGSILKVVPGNIEARLCIRTAKEAIAKPEEAPLVEAAKPRYCVYMAMGLVSYRQCTGDYNCLSCEFDRQIQERIVGEEAELIETLERYKSLPGNQKLCRYALKGDVSYRICSRFLQCDTCELNQMIEDAFQQQLIQRQQASCSKRQRWWWRYWGESLLS